MTAKVIGLVPMAHVADVQRSIDFYGLLDMNVTNTLSPSGKLGWAWVECENAQLMLTRATEPVPAAVQAVLFYLYSPDLVALRDHLLAKGIKVSSISYPNYMPKGEIRIEDPDGYVLLIGQAG